MRCEHHTWTTSRRWKLGTWKRPSFSRRHQKWQWYDTIIIQRYTAAADRYIATMKGWRPASVTNCVSETNFSLPRGLPSHWQETDAFRGHASHTTKRQYQCSRNNRSRTSATRDEETHRWPPPLRRGEKGILPVRMVAKFGSERTLQLLTYTKRFSLLSKTTVCRRNDESCANYDEFRWWNSGFLAWKWTAYACRRYFRSVETIFCFRPPTERVKVS